MAYPYTYKPTPSRLGIGVGSFAFQSVQSFPLVNPYSSDHLVRGCLRPLSASGGMNAAGQNIVAVSPRGNGLQLSGTYLLTRLAKAVGG